MDERTAGFLTRFSHEWAIPVLLLAVVVIVVTAVLRRFSRQHPQGVGLKRAAIASTVLAYGCSAFAILAQAHIPCARIAAITGKCALNIRALAEAQLMYAEEHDGRFLATADWQTKLKPGKHLTCPSASGPVSFAMNSGLSGLTMSTADPGQVLVFDANGKTVCGEACLAHERHNGRPLTISVDGSPNRGGRKPLKW